MGRYSNIEKVNGKQIATTVLSKAKWALGIENRYGIRRGKKHKRPTLEYWVKTIDYLGKSYGIEKSVIKAAKTNRYYFRNTPKTQRVKKMKRQKQTIGIKK